MTQGWEMRCTRLTYDIKVGKTYALVDGAVSSATDGNGYLGNFQELCFTSMSALNIAQNDLTSHQCLIAGISTVDAEFGKLGPHTERCHERSKEWFPEPYCHALVTCDIDVAGAPPTLRAYMGSAAEVAQLFFEVVPQLRNAALLVRPSSSNGVTNPDGSPAKAGGWHVHMIAPPGKRIEIMERLYVAFARAGFGWILVRKPNKRTGIPSLLKRNPIDTALLAPNQPIYSGPPRVEAPLFLKRPIPYIQEGCAIDPEWLPDEDRAAVEPIYDELKCDPAIQAQLETSIRQVAERSIPEGTHQRDQEVQKAIVEVRKRAQDAARGWLGPDVELSLYNGPSLTVAEILANPVRYHGALTLTPGEEDYRDGAQTGILYLDDPHPKLHTQAHGGITYRLFPLDPKTFQQNLPVTQSTASLPPVQAAEKLRSTVRRWPHEAPSLAVKATQGLGKTREVLARIADEPNLKFLFLAANLKQCQEVYEEYCHLHIGDDAAICRGRGAPDPDIEGALMCTQPARCEDALSRGATKLSTAACLKCPDFGSCGYQRQARLFSRKKSAPRVMFAAHDYAHFAIPGGWKPDALVLDEVLRTGGVNEEISVPDKDLTLQEWRDPTNALVAHDRNAEILDRSDPTAIRAHRHKTSLLKAMAENGVYYVYQGSWVVPTFRPFVHISVPVLVIDGTLRKRLLELQLQRDFELVEINSQRNVSVVHVVGNAAGSKATGSAFQKGEIAARFLRSLGTSQHALFTYKKTRTALGRDSDPTCGHFSGDIRGSNRFKDLPSAVIYGALKLPDVVAVGRARVLAKANGLDEPCSALVWHKRTAQALYGKPREIKYPVHTDSLVQDIIAAEREDEIEQAMDRLRLVWHEGDPKTVIIINNLPPPVTPDVVIDWEDFRDGRAAPPAMHATLTGLIPASPKQGPATRPDIWNSPDTSKAHMTAQLKPNWKDWFLKVFVRPKSSARRVEAFYRPSDCAYTSFYLLLLRRLGF